MRTDPTEGLGPVLTLEQAIDRDSRQFRGGMTALCAGLGEPFNAFQKRLSASYPENQLGARDFERWLELCDAENTLRTIARIKGGVFYKPASVRATRDSLLALSDLLAKESQFVRSLHEGADDETWERHEVEDLEHHGAEVVAQVLGIMLGARLAMEGGCDE